MIEVIKESDTIREAIIKILNCNDDFDTMLKVTGLSLDDIAEGVKNPKEFGLPPEAVEAIRKELEKREYYPRQRGIRENYPAC